MRTYAVDVAEVDARRTGLADALDDLAALSPDDAILSGAVRRPGGGRSRGVGRRAVVDRRAGGADLPAAEEGGRRRRCVAGAVPR